MLEWLKRLAGGARGAAKRDCGRGGQKRRLTPRGHIPGTPQRRYTTQEKLALLQEFEKSDLPIATFCKWHGVGLETLKKWKERYKAQGEAGLEDRPGGKPSFIPEAVREKIIELKQASPQAGSTRIQQELLRHNFVRVAANTILRILGADERTKDLVAESSGNGRASHKSPEPQRFERAKPRQLYQMDTFTWMLRGLYRIHLVGCLDDHSRFMAAWRLVRNATSSQAVDVVRDAIENYGLPEELLTDNGRQYYTWRGKCEFQKFLLKSGIRHIRSRPYHPQTLGKIESFWRNLHQELLSREPLSSFEEAEAKIKEWINHYNFKRPHQGIDGLTPADRFFGVEKPMREAMLEGAGMVKDALVLEPKRLGQPMYLVGRIGGREIRVIATQGSVVVEGLEGVEKKALQEAAQEVESVAVSGSPPRADETKPNPDRGAADDDGREEPIPEGHPCKREDGDAACGVERSEERGGGVPGVGNIQAGVLQVERESGGGAGEDAGTREGRAEAERPRE
jgi:transposase InsO family protein